MSRYVTLLSIPGLRASDLDHMPNLSALARTGTTRPLRPGFPAVTCPVQAAMTTGHLPAGHGVIANGFFYRDRGEVEMWTAWNECIQAPQIWEELKRRDDSITSAVWFPLHSKGASADYICTPAPIHNPDGSESLWCYTRPTEMYGELRDELGHFPLMNFWGPLASIKASDWIIDSAIIAARKYQPRFHYIYLPHLDYAAQKVGPDSDEALRALTELDASLGRLVEGMQQAGLDDMTWLVASEYVITEVQNVAYPNRLLREAGLLSLNDVDGAELLDPAASRAWAMVDHQFAHVFVRDAADIERTRSVLAEDPAIERVLLGDELREFGLNHERSGEIIAIARPDAWLAYYWWLDDARAPAFARTVDIHRKPGYDPVEMYIDLPSKQTPLDATLIRGSHGYPADDPSRYAVLVSSAPLSNDSEILADTDVFQLVLDAFGV